MAENPILIDEEQDKKNSPPAHPITPVSERPTQPPVTRTCSFGTRLRMFPVMPIEN